MELAPIVGGERVTLTSEPTAPLAILPLSLHKRRFASRRYAFPSGAPVLS